MLISLAIVCIWLLHVPGCTCLQTAFECSITPSLLEALLVNTQAPFFRDSALISGSRVRFTHSAGSSGRSFHLLGLVGSSRNPGVTTTLTISLTEHFMININRSGAQIFANVDRHSAASAA